LRPITPCAPTTKATFFVAFIATLLIVSFIATARVVHAVRSMKDIGAAVLSVDCPLAHHL
jgi:HAMP domain-containing protein